MRQADPIRRLLWCSWFDAQLLKWPYELVRSVRNFAFSLTSFSPSTFSSIVIHDSAHFLLEHAVRFESLFGDERLGRQYHDRMVVKPAPGPSLELVGTELMRDLRVDCSMVFRRRSG